MLISKAPLFTKNRERGFSLIEAVLAVSLFSLILLVLISAIIYGRESIALSGSRSRAILIAEEGQEVLRNLRDEKFANLPDGVYGLATSSNQWILSGASDKTDIFTRRIQIGTLSGHIKIATTTVTWQPKEGRSGQITLTSYLTQWRRERGGMLVYADRATVNDQISYRVLDPDNLTWETASSTADVDNNPALTNKTPRAVQVYSSATRNEKVMLSRHYDGSIQYIYAQVWNGISWGNVVQLSTWNNNTFLDVQNFSGTYLANGNFMVVYSDNSATPKFRIWNGSVWSAQVSMPNLSANGSGIPNFIVAKARPGTNEVMAAFFDRSSDTNTMYFNGDAYTTTNWTLHARHSGVAPVATKWLVDFVWSPNTATKGALIFSDSSTDKTLALRIWTANGAGSGSWSAIVNSAASGGRLGAMAIDGRRGADEFLACQKGANNDIYCFRGNATLLWAPPMNNILTATSRTGVQRSFDLAYESATGNLGLAVYSDNTATPKYRKYDPSTNAFDPTASSITVTGGGVLSTVRLIPQPDADDIMILMGDANNDLRSIVWNGTSDTLYTTPSGKTLNLHGVSGSATTDFWYDFAWDKF